jgi:hypothetical protein
VPGGGGYANVHVAVQRGDTVVELWPGDADSVEWLLDVKAVPTEDGGLDLRGPYVHGRRGDRFLYLSWGTVGSDGAFTMFRRAKLLLSAVDAATLTAANEPGARLVGRVHLTGPDGGPRCAAVRPPDIAWSVAPAS